MQAWPMPTTCGVVLILVLFVINFHVCPWRDSRRTKHTCTDMHTLRENDAQRARAVRFKSSHFFRDMPCSTYSGGHKLSAETDLDKLSMTCFDCTISLTQILIFNTAEVLNTWWTLETLPKAIFPLQSIRKASAFQLPGGSQVMGVDAETQDSDDSDWTLFFPIAVTGIGCSSTCMLGGWTGPLWGMGPLESASCPSCSDDRNDS